VDLGEVPEVEMTLNNELLDYFTSRAGTRRKIKTISLEQSGTIRLRMDELVPYNAQLFFIGLADMANPGGPKIQIMSTNLLEGHLTFTGTNDVGPHWDLDIPRFQLRPSRSLNMIQERDWGGMEITGEMLADATGNFGTATCSNFGAGDS
jgi:hypothetical protein